MAAKIGIKLADGMFLPLWTTMHQPLKRLN